MTTVASTDPSQALAKRTRTWRSLLTGSGGAFFGLLALFLVLSLTTPGFFSRSNLLNVIDQVTVLSIIAVGATAVIITGGIDLSVGSVLALSTMVLGWLAHDGGQPMWVAMIGAVVVGGLCGLANGIGVTVGKLPPFIATLAVMSIARGMANLITDGKQIVGYPDWFFRLSSDRYFGFLTVTALLVIIVFVVGGSICATARPVARSTRSAAVTRWPGWPASTCGRSPRWPMCGPASCAAWPGSCWQPVSTPPSPPPAPVSSSTSSRRSSSAAPASAAAPGASPAP